MTTSYDISTWRCLTMMGSWSSRGSCGGSRYTHQASFKCSYSWVFENLLGSSITSSLCFSKNPYFGSLDLVKFSWDFFLSIKKTLPKKFIYAFNSNTIFSNIKVPNTSFFWIEMIKIITLSSQFSHLREITCKVNWSKI